MTSPRDNETIPDPRPSPVVPHHVATAIRMKVLELTIFDIASSTNLPIWTIVKALSGKSGTIDLIDAAIDAVERGRESLSIPARENL